MKKINLLYSDIRDDKEYWNNIEEYEKSLQGKFMRLRLIDQVSNHSLNLEKLKLNGLSAAPQGPIKVKPELSEYLNKNFTDKYQIEYFPDTLNEELLEYEGLKKTIIVNKYERSSIAREKCFEFYGLNCFVWNMNFERVYGVLGKGFIHVHHIIPLNQIGKEYKVDYKKDLVPICPNCHSMLHRKINGKELSIQELKEIMNK